MTVFATAIYIDKTRKPILTYKAITHLHTVAVVLKADNTIIPDTIIQKEKNLMSVCAWKPYI